MKELTKSTRTHCRRKAPSSNAMPIISFSKVGVGDGDSMSLRNACYVVGGVTEEDCMKANIPYKQHAEDAGVDWSPFVFVEHVREVKRVLQRYHALVEKYKDAKATKRKDCEKENQARKELVRKLEAQVHEKKTYHRVPSKEVRFCGQ